MDVNALKVSELRGELEKRGQDSRGNRDVLRERLQEAVKDDAFDAGLVGPTPDVGPEDSASQVIRNPSAARPGSHLSITSMKAQESAKRAALKVRLSFVEEQQKAEREEKDAKDRRTVVELKAAIAEAEAREEALSQALSSKASSKVSKHTTAPAPTQLSDRQESVVSPAAVAAPVPAPVSGPTPPEPTSSQDLLMKKLLTASLLPKPDIPIFSGDTTRYHQFIRAFDNRVGGILEDDASKLFYLEQFTSSGVRDIVRGCMHMSAGGYQEARRILEQKYGNPDKVADCVVQRLMSWPNLKTDDVSGLEKLAVELRTAYNSVSSLVTGSSELDHPKSIRELLEKVPFSMQERWRREVDRLTNREKRRVLFLDFVKFVEVESRVASHSTFGRQVLSKKQSPAKAWQKEKKPHAVSMAVVEKDRRARSQSCSFCSSKGHQLDSCKEFMNLSMEGRKSFIFEKRICFGCLDFGHRSRQCVNRLKCEVCKKSHPSVMHIFRPAGEPRGARSASRINEVADAEPSSQTTVNVTTASCKTSGGRATKLPIVPVKVKHGDNPPIETYALLDSGSSSSFLTRGLHNQLGLESSDRTQLTITTMAQEPVRIRTTVVSGLVVSDLDENHQVELPDLFTLDNIPVSKDELCRPQDVDRWPHLREVVPAEIDAEVGLLLGVDVPRALEPIDYLPSKDDSPYAVQSRLGWAVNGPVENKRWTELRATANRIRVDLQQLHLEESLASEDRGFSIEDHRWQEKVEEECRLENGHFVVPIPLKKGDAVLPDNREVALRQLLSLKRRLNDESFAEKYCCFMNNMIENGFAEKVPEEDLSRADGHVNYLPHHGVFGRKLRVVFNASSSFQGVSLNDVVLQGPDLTTPLLRVLLRFRQEEIAFIGDIDSMFYQVSVPQASRDMLRFLWWKDGNTSAPVETYRMAVHPFGVSSSPSCASYALQRTAEEFGGAYSPAVSQTIHENMYVDDCCKSVGTEMEAIQLIEELRQLCSRGGFRLAKFVSNSRATLESLAPEDRGKSVRDLSMDEVLPAEKALGVQWSVELDRIGFSVSEAIDKPCTRRGMLSVIGGMFDPMGMASPFVLSGRRVLQEMTRRQLGWDDLAPDDLRQQWLDWLRGIPLLSEVGIPRCVKPVGFGSIRQYSLHHFSDASTVGLGVVSYLRITNEDGAVHCAFVFGKSRIAPLKTQTVPRLELMAATMAARIDVMLRKTLQFPLAESTFWTDSTTVIRYVRNETTRFHVFVSNRVTLIRDASSPAQWRYVSSAGNPADEASRGQSAQSFVNNRRWFSAPEFLWYDSAEWPSSPPGLDDGLESDPEVKHVVAAAVVSTDTDPLHVLFAHYSTWYRLARAVAWILRVKRTLLDRIRNRSSKTQQKVRQPAGPTRLCLSDLQDAESAIVVSLQRSSFPEEYSALQLSSAVKLSSPLAPLDPFLENDMIKVGGRLRHSSVNHSQQHPAVLPKSHHVVDLLIQQTHLDVGHSGREHVLSELRTRYWVISGNSAVRRVLSKCIDCRRRQGPFLGQKLADLPVDRVTSAEPPFSYCGVDLFGPFYVKRGRGQEKRYGVVFSCLNCRAVHIEIAASLSTDSFLCALYRFLARRGHITQIRCDRGTNLVGASRELAAEYDHLLKNERAICEAMLQRKIEWIFNVPCASSHGGVWERVIRTIRKVLGALLTEQSLTDESLQTFLCQVEAVINSRPITFVSSDSRDPGPLTPNHLLLAGAEMSIPAAVFSTQDLYARRRWRQSQYLAELFWTRWSKQYLPILQSRQKELRPQRSLSVGDVVLVYDDNLPRGRWPLGRVTETFPGRDGLVRSVKVRARGTEFSRPVTKLVLIDGRRPVEM